MKFKSVICRTASLVASVLAVGCSDTTDFGRFGGEDAVPIELSGRIEQEYVSRADESGFAEGDRMGVFIVDYSGGNPGTLAINGNRANNAIFERDGAGKWSSSTTFYWKDATTPIDVYGYYPYSSSVADVSSHPFEVSYNQKDIEPDAMGGYEASDFLWAKVTCASQSGNGINLTYSHRMAGVKVILTKGEGMEDADWAKSKDVAVENVTRFSTVNLSTGTVTSTGNPDRQIAMGDQKDDSYRAVVVPQSVASGKNILSVTIDGNASHLALNADLSLQAGKLHTFTLKVDKKESGDYSVALISQEITPWENDALSHNFLEYAYTVVKVTEPGTLQDAISAMGKDAKTIKNLKIIGPITTADFNFMRDGMDELAMLNMKEAPSRDVEWTDQSGNFWGEGYEPTEIKMDNAIPGGLFESESGFYGKESLRRIIFNDEIERIGQNAFRKTGLDANSSVVLPANLKRVDEGAFGWIGQAGELVLNDKLEYIGKNAFAGTAFTCELRLPQTLRYIGVNAFGNESNNNYFMKMSGSFRLPDNLEFIGNYAFEGVKFDGVGELIVPGCVTDLGSIFPKFERGVRVTFHDNIRKIGQDALREARFINHVRIPEGVTEIGGSAFEYTYFNGGITLPGTLHRLGVYSFRSARIPGEIEIPEGVEDIPVGCFAGSEINVLQLPSTLLKIEASAFEGSNIQSLTIGKNCDFIGVGAFNGMNSLQTLVCLNPEPPTIDKAEIIEAFSGCSFDHLTLQVPEGSVEKYRNAAGWKQIRFISAYHELSVGVDEIECLDKGLEYNTLVRAEGGWTVSACPDWVEVNPVSSTDRRTEVRITVKSTAVGTGREGQITFKLNDKDYTASIKVHQLACVDGNGENVEIPLVIGEASVQKIPVLFVGEGFTASQIRDGKYMEAMREACDNFFAIEPFKGYKEYFNASAAIAVSPDEGIEQNNMSVNKFHFRDAEGLEIDWNLVRDYAASINPKFNPSGALIVVVPNYNAFTGLVNLADDAENKADIAVCCYVRDTYPYDFRGLVQHYAGGLAFGRLAPEYVTHYEFIRGCKCPSCNGLSEYLAGQAKGWYGNISLNGARNSVPWSHLISNDAYKDIVDVYEGGFRHLRGVYRSENQSCMSTYINYFNTISRELIVKKIMKLTGNTYSFDSFVSKDSREGHPDSTAN